MHEEHRRLPGAVPTQQPHQAAIRQFVVQHVGRQPGDAGAGQGGLLQQAVVVAGEVARHLHPLQLVLAVVEPLLVAGVVGVQQALVAGQLRRGVGFTVAGQVVRGGAGDFLQGEQRPGHQPLVLMRAAAHAQVEALGNQVAVGIAQVQLHPHRRVLAGEVQQQRIEEGLPQGHRHADPHPSGHLLLQALHRLPCHLRLGHQGAGLGQQRGASRREVQAPGGAVQQRRAQPLLQMTDALGQLPLAAPQPFGRAGKAARFQQDGERRQVVEFAHAPLTVSK